MCVCIYICARVWIYIYIYIYMYVCIYNCPPGTKDGKVKVKFSIEQTTKAQGERRGIALLFI